jgi:hypothetical protein
MTAGELTADYIGSTVTAHDVGHKLKRTVELEIAVVTHDKYGDGGSYRTYILGTNGQSIMVPAGHPIELTA